MSLTDRIASLLQRDAATTIGAALTAVWLFLIALFWLFVPGTGTGSGGVARLVSIMGAALPLVLIWMAVGLARALAQLRAEADDLRQRMSQMREMAATRGAPPPSQREPQAMVADARPAAQPQRPAPRPAEARPADTRPTDQRQAAMRFEGPENVAIDADTLIRALDFPEGPQDTVGIAALRAALRDQDKSRVLRAAQDVVTLLAGHDLYMDDLPALATPVAAWRRFADGARGDAVSSLGQVGNDAALDLTTALLSRDEIFRDTAHHFLRHFDVMLSRSLPQMDDDQIAALAQTRSTRAFTLLGRASGTFG